MVIQFINQQEMDKMNKRRKNMRVAKMLGKRITAFVMAALMVLSLSGITGMTVKAAEKDDTIKMQLQDTKKIECSAWIAYETKWSVTSGKDKVTLKNTNKKEVSVIADKTGTVTLKCKYKNYLFQWKTEKYTIKISKRTPVFEESISNLTYNGKVQTLNAKNFVKDGPKSGIVGTCDKEILNAGTYTYTITTPATDVYEAGSRTYTITVNKAEAVIKEKPSATINHMSGKLRESHLNGGMAVAVNDENQELEGHFEWQSPDETLWFNTTGTAIFEDVDHHVVFVPEGNAAENYKETVFIVPVRTYLKALYANLTASDFEYNGSNDEKNLSCDANAYSWGIEKNPSISITYTYYDEAGNKLSKAPVDAGIYTVIATASAKKFESADSNEATFTIRQKTLTNEMVTAKDTEYTGNTVAVVVKDGDKTLVEGKDYTVIYSGSNPNAGETSAAITGIGNYKGTVNTTYTILPKEVENDSVIATAKEKYYTGKAVTLSEEDVTVTYNGKVLTAGTDYTVGNYKDNVEEGTALATVTFTGNYSGTVNVSFGISKIRAKVYAKYGNGKLLLLSGNCILDPAVLEEAADYATTEESVIHGFILEDENAGVVTTYTKLFRNTEGYNVYVKVADTFTQKAEFYIRKAGTVRPEGTVGDATANYDYVGRAAVSLNQLKVTTDMSGFTAPASFDAEKNYDGKMPVTLASVLDAYAANSGIAGDDARFYRIEWYRMINPNSWHIDGEIVDNSYTVTFMVDGNVYQEVREVKGTEVSVTDPVKAETETTTYEFTGWTLEDGSKVNVADLNDSTVVYASFDEKEKETEPTEPVGPTGPTEPTQPTEPTEPTEPTQPTEPSQPTEPTKPAESTQPAESTEPAQPANPTQPASSETAVTPADNNTQPETAAQTPVTPAQTPITQTQVAQTPVRQQQAAQQPQDAEEPVVLEDEEVPLANVTDDNAKQEVTALEDEAVPLAANPAGEDNCIIHWIMMILTIAFAGYNVVRAVLRQKKNA